MSKDLASGPIVKVGEITAQTRAMSLNDITGEVKRFIAESGVSQGLVTLFIRHTSASLIIQENADPDVQADLVDALELLAPRDAPYRHDAEGPDDMPAHIKSALTGASTAIPIANGAPMLGTWQAIYIAEHRDTPHRRSVAIHVSGI